MAAELRRDRFLAGQERTRRRAAQMQIQARYMRSRAAEMRGRASEQRALLDTWRARRRQAERARQEDNRGQLAAAGMD